MARGEPNVLITGTPGTGKTTMSSALAEAMQLCHINIGDLVKEKSLHDGWDEEFNCHVINEDLVCDELEDMMEEGGIIFDYHGCDFFPERWFDRVVVLQTENSILYDRLSKRGYTGSKLSNNIECEIFQVLLEEAKESYPKDIVVAMRSDSIGDITRNVTDLTDWVSSWCNRPSQNDNMYHLHLHRHQLNPPAMDESDFYPDRIASSSSSASTTSVHVTALDGLVNVNSLFTIAVFVGLSLTTPGQRSLENRSSCDAGADVAKKLLVFEVVSFSFFLFSSLVAQGLKLAINILNSKDVDEVFRAHINTKVLRVGMLGSAVGSVMGCLFLMLSMVNVIEIRLGLLSCGSKSAVRSVTALVILVTSALLVYISTAVYAFLH